MTPDVELLRTPEAIRERCGMIFAAAERGGLRHFRFHPERMATVVEMVRDEISANYPALDVPYHSRWRHFEVRGVDHSAPLFTHHDESSRLEIARARFELAITSVLLDAGAGARWSFRDPVSGERFARSEGLAMASLHAFRTGVFGDGRPQATGRGLSSLTPDDIGNAFQVSPENPLIGVEGRTDLLVNLGKVVVSTPEVFGQNEPRLGNLFDFLANQGATIAARSVLSAVLRYLGPIWPGRLELDGVNLGDVWKHYAVSVPGPTNGMVPIHKLSQWLTYSLLEPLEQAGVQVTGIDELTGLAEYRNGGLFLDGGVLSLAEPTRLAEEHPASSELIVEWRALTVILLDRVARDLRLELGLSADQLPLAKVLQGGTWSVGRKLAAEKRPGAAPPLSITSDGTIF